jgi:hypothetical protein
MHWLAKLARFAAQGVAWLVVVVYLAEPITQAPNHVDEGYLLESVRLVAAGQRVFWDFIDIYGPLNYTGPALFYDLFGGEAVGVRVWVLIVKVVCVALAFFATRRFADALSAWLALAWTTVLLGLPWQAMQMPFAYLHAVPFLLAAYALLLAPPLGHERLARIDAGVLTSAVLLIKVSTGAFCLAAGAAYCSFWLPRSEATPTVRSVSASGKRLELAGLLAFGAAFLFFVRHKIDWLFYLYLDVPLLVVLGFTAAHVLRDDRRAAFSVRARAALEYVAASVVAALLLCVAYFGVAGTLRYIREMALLIHVMKYDHPVLPVGKRGSYEGFNEYFWMQLPWTITLLFVVWAVLGARGRGERAFGNEWPRQRALAAGLSLFTTLGVFVFYQYGTEVHLLSGVLSAGPCVFVLLFQIRRILSDRAAVRGASTSRAALAPAVTLAVAVWLSTLIYLPRLDSLSWHDGDWTVSSAAGRTPSDNRLSHLRFRQPGAPGVTELSAQLPSDEWDRAINDAAVFVDEITRDDEEILVLSQDEIVPFHSFTRHVGGRYRLAFFWLRIGLLDRDGFDRLVPRRVLQDLLEKPPRVLVSALGDRPALLEPLPELRAVLERARLVRSFAYIQILEQGSK